MNRKASKSSNAASAMPLATSETTKTSRHRRIVLGIADATLRQRIAARLSNLSSDIQAVGDGLGVIERLAEALEWDEEPRPGLLVLDAVLPGITGISLLTSLRELDWQLPIVILAAPGDEAAIDRARKAGASSVLMTPFSLEQLHHVAERELSLNAGKGGIPLLPIGRRRTRVQAGTRSHKKKPGYKSSRLSAAREVNSNA